MSGVLIDVISAGELGARLKIEILGEGKVFSVLLADSCEAKPGKFHYQTKVSEDSIITFLRDE